MEDLYAPPLTIKVKDERSFGQCPLVGTHVVKSLKRYMVDEPKPSDSHKLAVAVAHKSVAPTPSLYEEDVVVVVEDVKEALDVRSCNICSYVHACTYVCIYSCILLKV